MNVINEGKPPAREKFAAYREFYTGEQYFAFAAYLDTRLGVARLDADHRPWIGSVGALAALLGLGPPW